MQSSTLLSAGIDTYPELKDITHLTPEAKADFLHKQRKISEDRKIVDRNVYLLQGTVEEAVARIMKVRHNAFDIDGTLTGVGDKSLYNENIQGIRKVADTGVTNIGITGRHLYQVKEMEDNHPNGTGLDHYLIEQAFYKWQLGGTPELFAGDKAIEQNVHLVRERIQTHLAAMEAKHGVSFVTTSAEGYPAAHQTMYSLDAHIPGGPKIASTEIEKHHAIIGDFKDIWGGYDLRGEIAKVGSSSTGTFEFTPDGLTKEKGLVRHMSRNGLEADQIGFFGDSGNDLSVFASQNEYLKSVIVNGHTNPDLIANARFATVGTGNASPLLEHMNRVRRAGA